MSTNITQETGTDVSLYMAAIGDSSRIVDCQVLSELMSKATKQPVKLWWG